MIDWLIEGSKEGFFKWVRITEDFKSVGNLDVDKDRLVRWRTIGKKIDERSLNRLVGKRSKVEVVDDIELIISERSEKLIGENVERESVLNLVKVGGSLLLKERIKLILSVMYLG